MATEATASKSNPSLANLPMTSRHPPEHALPAYTLDGTIPVEHFYVNETDGGEPIAYSAEELGSLIEEMKALLREPHGWRAESERWLSEAIRSELTHGSRAVVFGSVEPWVECLLLASGASHVTVVEYHAREYPHPQLSTTTVSQFTARHFDLAIAHAAFDHDGLGRYGDPLRPDGDLLAMRTAWRALRPGGKLLISLPVGPDLLVWNLHRRYGRRRLPRMLAGWEEVGRVGWREARLSAEADHRQRYEPVFILRRNASEDEPRPGPQPPLVEVDASPATMSAEAREKEEV